MKKCFLVRHGATDMAGRFCGHSDPPLNRAGHIQIERVASLLPVTPEAIYSSDLLRARESADVVAAHFRVSVRIRPGLREIDFGQWEGLSWEQIEQRFPTESTLWLERFPAGVVPFGEQYDQFAIRVKSEIAFLASEAESRNVLAVTHGGVIRTALTEVFGMTSDDAVRLSADYGAIVDLSALEARPL
jgi:broad specificity phosphatase PhoE